MKATEKGKRKPKAVALYQKWKRVGGAPLAVKNIGEPHPAKFEHGQGIARRVEFTDGKWVMDFILLTDPGWIFVGTAKAPIAKFQGSERGLGVVSIGDRRVYFAGGAYSHATESGAIVSANLDEIRAAARVLPKKPGMSTNLRLSSKKPAQYIREGLDWRTASGAQLSPTMPKPATAKSAVYMGQRIMVGVVHLAFLGEDNGIYLQECASCGVTGSQ